MGTHGGKRTTSNTPSKSATGGKNGEKGSQRQPILCGDEWVSKAEAARIRGITRQAIAKLVSKGKFGTLKIGGRTFLRRSEVATYQSEPPGRPRK